jgi:hypothetical protein
MSILAACPFLASGAHQSLILPAGDEIVLAQSESRSVIQKADVIEDIVEIIKKIIGGGGDDRDDEGDGDTNP